MKFHLLARHFNCAVGWGNHEDFGLPSLLGEGLLDTQMQANLDQRAMVQLMGFETANMGVEFIIMGM